MVPLATPADLAARMTNPPDPAHIDAALADSSATVRAFSGQMFTRMVTTTVINVMGRTAVRLAQRPVNDVIEVTAAPTDEPVSFYWPGGDRIIVDPCQGYLAVTYDHGYDVIPDDIVAVTCNVAARALSNPPEDAGLMSRTITNYTESFGAVGAAGPAGLFQDERAILARYQRPGASARLTPR